MKVIIKIKITYNDLYKEVNLASYILQRNNIKKGDRIIIYMPTIPEVIISMLSCCRICAIHSIFLVVLPLFVYEPSLRGEITVIFEGKPIGTPNSGKTWEIM